MDRTALLSALAADGAAFGDACASVPLDAPVSTCPGWSVADLLWHLTEVHQFWRTVVRDQLADWRDYPEPTRPADDVLPAMYRDGLVDTIEVLTAVDPMRTTWTWSDDHTAGFVVRRMAQETAVHRWDAQHASGGVQPIEATLASDGIDEFLEHFAPDGRQGGPALGGSVHLHCTDVAGEWLVRDDDAGTSLVLTREHAKGDAAMRGAASDLLLVLWRRLPISTIDVIGDAAVAQRLVDRPPLE